MDDLTRRVAELATLHAIGEILNRESDFPTALHLALERLVELVDVDTAWVFLARVPEAGDPHFLGLELGPAVGLPPALTGARCAALRDGSCECEGMFRRGELDEGLNVVECTRLRHAEGDKGGLEIHASVPLKGRGGTPLGILNLASAGAEPFDAQTLRLLDAVGSQLGMGMERAALLDRRQREAKELAAREERDRLARDVHDAVSQLLFAADLSLQVACESPDDELRGTAVQRAAELVASSMRELRGLVELLRSADLDEGLDGALARLVARTTGTMKVHLHADAVALPDEVAEGLYRCAQECVHNAMKHAEADNVWIRLERLARSVRLVVEDDGTGFPDDVLDRGVRSLRDRTRSIAARLRLRNRREGGARVDIVVSWRPGS